MPCVSGHTFIQRIKEICQTSLNINYKLCVRANNVLTHIGILILRSISNLIKYCYMLLKIKTLRKSNVVMCLWENKN